MIKCAVIRHNCAAYGKGSGSAIFFFSQCAMELSRRNPEYPMWIDGPDAIEDFYHSRRGLAILQGRVGPRMSSVHTVTRARDESA